MTPRRALKVGGTDDMSRRFLEAVEWLRRNDAKAPVAVSIAVEREVAERAQMLIAEGVWMWNWPQGALS